jgi:hypothetical protein
MLIPFDYGQVNWKLTGTGLPSGAEVTCGFWHHNFAGTVQDAAEALWQTWADNVMPLLASSVAVTSALVKYGPNDDGAAYEFVDSQAGTAGSETSPPNAAVLVTKQTIVGGRKGRGRMYVPGIPEADVSPGGLIAGATVTAWNAAFEDMRDEATGLNLPFRLLHGEYDPQPAPYSIEAFSVTDLLATQRRRLRR